MSTYKCSDGKNRSVDEIKEELSPFAYDGLIFEYKTHQYVIQFFDNNCLNGYVINVDEQDIDYVPHGEITGGYKHTVAKITGIGFDCGHYDDITLNSIRFNYLYGNGTFKMPSFVHEECKKMIDSILI